MTFENRVLRGMFEPKREEVTAGCERLHNLYPSPNIVREMKSRRIRSGACSTHGSDEKRIQNFGPKTLREEKTRKT
jgi:hypothetical protein